MACKYQLTTVVQVTDKSDDKCEHVLWRVIRGRNTPEELVGDGIKDKFGKTTSESKWSQLLLSKLVIICKSR